MMKVRNAVIGIGVVVPLMLFVVSHAFSRTYTLTPIEKVVTGSRSTPKISIVTEADQSSSARARFGSSNISAEVRRSFRSRFQGMEWKSSSSSSESAVNPSKNSFTVVSSAGSSRSRATPSRNLRAEDAAKSNSTFPSRRVSFSGCEPTLLERLGLRGQCGKVGWEFPGLVGGDCPVTSCIIDVEAPEGSPFGPL